MDEATATRALAAVIDIDETLAADTDRLARALSDLLPYHPRDALLCVLRAVGGVATLARTDHLVEGYGRLVGESGLRHGVAEWVISVWRAATPDATRAARTAKRTVATELPQDTTLLETPGKPAA